VRKLKNITILTVAFALGMIADSTIFRLPNLQECYDTSNEVMDVVDYYTVMLGRALNTCEDVIEDNIQLTRRHRMISVRNAELVTSCKTSGVQIER